MAAAKPPTVEQLEHQIERLQDKVAQLYRALEASRRETRLKAKHLRDSYMGAVLTGLCMNWKWGDTPSRRVAEQAERLVNAVMEQRALWEQGQSVNQLNPPAAPAAPAQPPKE